MYNKDKGRDAIVICRGELRLLSHTVTGPHSSIFLRYRMSIGTPRSIHKGLAQSLVTTVVARSNSFNLEPIFFSPPCRHPFHFAVRPFDYASLYTSLLSPYIGAWKIFRRIIYRLRRREESIWSTPLLLLRLRNFGAIFKEREREKFISTRIVWTFLPPLGEEDVCYEFHVEFISVLFLISPLLLFRCYGGNIIIIIMRRIIKRNEGFS